jgi:hypothetical protein
MGASAKERSMNGTIKAIETRYKGYRFRSRLEARWAVFFDALNLEWEYEPEGFDLGALGWYLPDFYIKSWNLWIEVKPGRFDDPAIASQKCHAFRVKAQTLLLIMGNPFKGEHQVHVFRGKHQYIYGHMREREDPANGYIIEVAEGDFRYLFDVQDEPMLQRAFEAARGARFEHGENGAGK